MLVCVQNAWEEDREKNHCILNRNVEREGKKITDYFSKSFGHNYNHTQTWCQQQVILNPPSLNFRTLDMARNRSLHRRRRMKRTFKWRLTMRYCSPRFSVFHHHNSVRYSLCVSIISHIRCEQLPGTQQEPSSLPWRGNACWRLQVWLTRRAAEKVSPTSKCPTSPLNRRCDASSVNRNLSS